jgi:hypothetical protein
MIFEKFPLNEVAQNNCFAEPPRKLLALHGDECPPGANRRQELLFGLQEATPFEWGGSLFILYLIGRLQKADF